MFIHQNIFLFSTENVGIDLQRIVLQINVPQAASELIDRGCLFLLHIECRQEFLDEM